LSYAAFDDLPEHSFKSVNSISGRRREKTMSWLTNASTIATLIVAIFGIAGYIYGITSYLRKRAHSTGQNSGSAVASTSKAQKSSIPYRPLSWLEWTEMFAEGLVDTANFVIGLFPLERETRNLRDIQRIGYCCMICGFGIFFGEIILGLALGIFLAALGMSNPVGVTIAIVTTLFFMTFSLLYIYHVGLRVELRQYEQYQKIKNPLPPQK
jgi:hypothetical protein